MEYLKTLLVKERVDLSQNENAKLLHMFEMLGNQQSIKNIAKEALNSLDLIGEISFFSYEDEKFNILAFNGKREAIEDYLNNKKSLKFILDNKKPYFRSESEKKFPNYYVILPLLVKRENNRDELLGVFSIHTEQEITCWDKIAVAVEFITTALNVFYLSSLYRDSTIRDIVTHLYNQRYFKVQLGLEISKKLRHHIPLWLLVFDIENFDSFNHKLGGGWNDGDEVLKKMSLWIKQSLRDTDMPCRYEADTFMVLISNIPEEFVHVPLERILAKVEDSFIRIGNRNMKIRVKAAAVPYDDAYTTPDDYLQAGLEAVGKGKRRIEQ